MIIAFKSPEDHCQIACMPTLILVINVLLPSAINMFFSYIYKQIIKEYGQRLPKLFWLPSAVWIQMRPNILSGLIEAQTVNKYDINRRRSFYESDHVFRHYCSCLKHITFKQFGPRSDSTLSGLTDVQTLFLGYQR